MKLKFGLAFIFFLLWFFRYQNALPKELQEGQKIRITATLETEPQLLGNSQRFELAGIKIKARRFPEFHWGDRLVVTGQLKVIQRNRFYREYWLEWPEIDLSSLGNLGDLSFKARFFSSVFSLKQRLVSTYRRSLPEPHASLLAGIVLGEKSALPTDFWQALKKTGTLHIVVASGANITFLAGFLMGILPLLFSRQLAYLVMSVLIWFYVVLAGAEAPVVRAGMMGTIAFFGLLLGKRGEAVKSLLIAAVVLLLVRPLSLFDLGFQLSFAATLGIILFSHCEIKLAEGASLRILRTLVRSTLFRSSRIPPGSVLADEANKNQSRLPKRKPPAFRLSSTSKTSVLGEALFSNQTWGVIEKLPKGLKSALKTTLSAQIFTTPIIFLNFLNPLNPLNSLNFVWLSPLVNVLVYWTIPFLMALGSAAGILGLFWEPLGRLFCFLAYPLLEYFVKIAGSF